MRRVETDNNPTENDVASASVSYVFKEEEQIAQLWNSQDRAEHEQRVREIMDRTAALRQSLEQLRAQVDASWERFTTLTLERILSGKLREFLDEIDVELQELDLRLVGADCEIDRLRARIQEWRRVLEEKIAVLEPLTHRISTQNHICMMLSRVEELETFLLGKEDVTPEAEEARYKGQTGASSDLLYVRIRLLTTRIAIIASNRVKHLSDLSAGLATLLTDVERLKVDMAALLNRADCIRDLSRYWLAYLNITQAVKGEE